MTPATLWRVFPWNASARAGERFSASFIPAPTGRGRFDLPGHTSSVLYLAETPEHAVAELLHPWSGQAIDDHHLLRAGHPLAAVEVELIADPVADLCDPDVLVQLGVAPDRVASRHRARTQSIARTVLDSGYMGLRWWSRFWGDWHTTVLFIGEPEGRGRSASKWTLGEPQQLTTNAPAVVEAARLLGIEIVT